MDEGSYKCVNGKAGVNLMTNNPCYEAISFQVRADQRAEVMFGYTQYG